jgi:hypothetical protein
MTSRFFAALSAAAFVTLICSSPWATTVARAQANKKSAPDVSGRWTLKVEGTPHGAMTMGLVLKEEATKVTGTFESPHGDMPVEGEFVDGTLTLATSGGESSQITFNGKLKDNGTLAGFLSSAMGDMTWTAERVKDSK